MKRFWTCEFVSEGHPDKICDQIADAILDECLKQDPLSRSAIEVAIKTPEVYVFGELTTNAKFDYEGIVKDVIREIGYIDDSYGFNVDNCRILLNISRQSSDIKQGVDSSGDKGLGAGDQGMMYGYATDESKNYLPLAFDLSRRMLHSLREARKTGRLSYLRPDAKSQVTISYQDDRPKRIERVVISSQHAEGVALDKIKYDIVNNIILPLIPKDLEFNKNRVEVNPTGRFVNGGPAADSGLTGRKNIVDTYGGVGRHGGGSFSGKDPTKVDRSAAYYSRYVAKHIVASGLAKRCEVGVAYIIGISEPCMVSIDTDGTSKVSDDKIEECVKEIFDFSPQNIIRELKLQAPIFKQTSKNGHFGFDGYPWEELKEEKLNRLKQLANGKILQGA